MHILHLIIMVVFSTMLTGCLELTVDEDESSGSSVSSGTSSSDSSSSEYGTGYYVDATVRGITYVSGSITGTTASDGSFTYEVGYGVTFSFGGITLRTIASSYLSDGATIVETNTTVGALLQSLDYDSNTSNGIYITSSTITTMENAGWTTLGTDTDGRVTGTNSAYQVQNLTDVFSGITEVNITQAEDHIKSTIATLEKAGATFVNSDDVDDIKALTILSVSPDENETSVPTSSDINITFNKTVSSASGIYLFETDDFDSSDIDISNAQSYSSSVPSSSVMQISPSGLSADTNYTVLVSTSFEAYDGSEYESNTSWWFKTASSASDSSSASVVYGTYTYPGKLVQTVAVGADLNVTWDKNISSSSSFSSDISVIELGGSTEMLSSCSYDSSLYTVTCSLSTLDYDTWYEVNVGSFTDTDGVSSNTATWQFKTTSSSSDTTSPTILSVSPDRNSTDNAINLSLSITFDEDMNTSTLDSSALSIGGYTCSSLGGTLSNTVQTLTCSAMTLSYDTNYTVILSDIEDESGNDLDSTDTSWWFETTSQADSDLDDINVTYPSYDQENLPRNTNIIVTFGEEMDEDYINCTSCSDGNISLKKTSDSTAITSTVQYVYMSGGTNYAILNPSSTLDSGTTYTVYVENLKDLAGNQMSGTYTSRFTTAGTSDTVQPTIASKTPDGDTDVAKNANIEVTFSETMNSSTVESSSNWSVKDSSSNSISGDIEYNSKTNTAVFDPDSNLSAGKTYTVTVDSALEDTSGNSLDISDGSNVWTFTVASSEKVPPSVESKTPYDGETNVPVNKNIVIEFSEEIDPYDINSSSIYLYSGSSTVSTSYYYNGGVLVLTPGSNLSYGTDYNVTISSGVSDLSGNEMGIDHNWTFTTASSEPTTGDLSVSSKTPTGTNIQQDTNITIEFDMNMTNGAVSIEDFMVYETYNTNNYVTGTITLDEYNVTFNPDGNLSADTNYTVLLNDAVDEYGNRISDSYSWTFKTDSNTSASTTVAWVYPADNTTDVPTNLSQVWVRFSQEMNESSITTSNNNFYIWKEGAGNLNSSTVVTWSDDSKTAYLNLSFDLDANADYNLSVVSSVTDTSGNTLGSDYNWSFTTGSTADETRPEVNSSALYPEIGGVSIPVNTVASIMFSEDMACGTVTGSNLYLVEESSDTVLETNVTCYGQSASIKRSDDSNLSASTSYLIEFNSSDLPTDIAGNTLITPSWYFTTGSDAVDSNASVSSVSPGSGDSNVSKHATLTITFDRDMAYSSISTSTVKLYQSGNTTQISGSIYMKDFQNFVFDPDNVLEENATFNAGIVGGTSGVMDSYGNNMSSDYNWSFVTVGQDSTAPTISDVLIDGWQSIVDANSTITYSYVSPYPVFVVEFSEEINESSIITDDESNATIFLTYEHNETNVTGTYVYDSDIYTVTFEPSEELNVSADMNITIKSSIGDTSGNSLGSDFSFRFHTAD